MTYPAPIPLDEDARLQKLRSLQILDSGPEPIFDALVRMAASVCDAPMACISMVDAHRQWFKANIGLPEVTESARDQAFCAHAILSPGLMEVPDTTQDPRFTANPLVTEAPHIRFYAGAPIAMADGENMGTVCVMDRQPRVLTDVQRATLADLALVAAKALGMRQGMLALDHLREEAVQRSQDAVGKDALYRGIVEDQSDLVSLALPNGELTFVNETYAKHFGTTPEAMVGRNLLEYVNAHEREAVATHLRDLCQSPGTALGENRMHSASGEECWMAWSNRSIGDAHGRVVALHSVGRNITDSKRTEQALKTNQDRLRALYESTPAMLHSIDPHGRLVHVSDTWLAKMGYTRDEVIGRTSAEFLTAASREHAHSVVLPHFLQAGRCDDVAYQMVRKDGSTMDVLLSAVLERDAQGQPAYSLAVIQDVTEKNAISKALRANEERLALATHVNGVGIWELDLATGRLEWNDTMFTIFGGTRASFKGTLADWSGKLHPDDVERSMHMFKQAITTRSTIDIDFRVMHSDGKVRYVNARAVVINDAQGNAARVLGSNHDISERKKIERALQDSEKRLRLITNNLPVLIAYIDAEERFHFVNETYRNWLGIRFEDAIGRSVLEVMGQELYDQRRSPLQRALRGERMEFEMNSMFKGTHRYLHITYIPDIRSDGIVHGAYTLSTDVTALKQVEQELRNLARIDTLTGLPNRRQFNEKLELAISRCGRTGNPMALMFLDIDHFKSINDSLGHGAGDEVLREFANRIRNGIRITDTAARLAGDEFVIILENLKRPNEAESVVEKLVEAIRQPMQAAGNEVLVTASIGVTLCHSENIAAKALLARADRALYRAKSAGRNTFVMDEPPAPH
jgi:diguanylate cyclase (GGDEF)-like protein/PAS domain S-box-containing protein